MDQFIQDSRVEQQQQWMAVESLTDFGDYSGVVWCCVGDVDDGGNEVSFRKLSEIGRAMLGQV